MVLALVGAAPGATTGRAQSASGSRPITLPLILAIEDARAPTRADLDVLMQALRGNTRDAAIRALGRLERRDVITDLLPFASTPSTRAEAATALVLALRGEALEGVPHGQQEQAVMDALLAAGAAELNLTEPGALGSVVRALGRFPYERLDQFKAAETLLRQVLEKRFPKLDDAPQADAALGLEALARLNRKIAALDDDTQERLRDRARTIDPKRAVIQRSALAALVAAQGLDQETLEVTLASSDTGVRRLSMVTLAGAGSNVLDDERPAFIRTALQDTSFMVRLEAVRAWTRHGVRDQGCQPLLDALSDSSQHVVLTAMDALGDQCRDDQSITDRVASEARTPKTVGGGWQREAHAFVALAKRDRERASLGMMTFATHNVWQVRMYAARAAAILDDVPVLSRLAGDPDNNVVETALPPLRRLIGARSDTYFVAALKRTNRASMRKTVRPYQVIRTAARGLEGASPTVELIDALTGALERITKEDCETSRDTRLALIERLGVMGSAAQANSLMPLLKDVDPVVATAAAVLIERWTGRAVNVEPKPAIVTILSEAALNERVRVTFEMDNGGTFEIAALPSAPLTNYRFLAAAKRGYYDGLTFHRVVPNFVIQGGSPDANEYCGDCPFMRDELGSFHRRGTLGISTRGRDTGDAQIFVNLVDNHRLDYDYTAFAVVCGDGMAVVDKIQEGDRIVRVRVTPEKPTCGG